MIAHLLNKTASRYARTRTGDGRGGFTVVNTLVDTFPCRQVPASRGDLELAGLRQVKCSDVIYAKSGQEMNLGETLTIDGVSYEITIPASEPSVAGVYAKALVYEIKTGA